MIFTAAPAFHEQVEAIALESGVRLTCIGKIIDGQGVKMMNHVTGKQDQRLIDISFSGYDHFRLHIDIQYSC